MYRCIQLALNGKGFVAPNPMVGAIIVYNDKIIGEGFHSRYGEAHAEVVEHLFESLLDIPVQPYGHVDRIRHGKHLLD